MGMDVGHTCGVLDMRDRADTSTRAWALSVVDHIYFVRYGVRKQCMEKRFLFGYEL